MHKRQSHWKHRKMHYLTAIGLQNNNGEAGLYKTDELFRCQPAKPIEL